MMKRKRTKYVGVVVPTEHNEQKSLFQRLEFMMRDNPRLGMAYAIPNGTRTTIRVAKKMKAEGVKSGMPDIHYPVARNGYLSLYIEMKARPYKNTEGKVVSQKLSGNQKRCKAALEREGHLVLMAEGWEEALGIILTYDAGKPTALVTPRPGEVISFDEVGI